MRRNIPVNLIEILYNLFSGCLACIRWGNSWSIEFAIEFGARQGSMLSPFLFAIYLDDLVALCKPERKLFIVLYADDILLLAPTITALQKLLDHTVLPANNTITAITPSRRASPRFGRYSLRLPTEGWPG